MASSKLISTRRSRHSSRKMLACIAALLFAAIILAAATPPGTSATAPPSHETLLVSHASSTADDAAIRRLLAEQAEAWNRGDLDAFLAGYWNSATTAFAGTQGILHGWQAVRERFRRSYSDRKAMGTLTFSELAISPLCADAGLVLGHWQLARETGPVGGVFSLVLRRFPEGWRIIADHTSTVPAAN